MSAGCQGYYRLWLPRVCLAKAHPIPTNKGKDIGETTKYRILLTVSTNTFRCTLLTRERFVVVENNEHVYGGLRWTAAYLREHNMRMLLLSHFALCCTSILMLVIGPRVGLYSSCRPSITCNSYVFFIPPCHDCHRWHIRHRRQGNQCGTSPRWVYKIGERCANCVILSCIEVGNRLLLCFVYDIRFLWLYIIWRGVLNLMVCICEFVLWITSC